MAKPAITRKLIAGIIIAILATSAILLGIKTMQITGPTELEEPQNGTGSNGPTEGTGSTELGEETGTADETRSGELQDKQGPNVPICNSGLIDIFGMIGENGFTVIHISDTQALSQGDSWGNFTPWLVSVVDPFNVKMIVHTGDIVQNYNVDNEWIVANTSMGVLAERGIPYCWCAGNHEGWSASEYIGNNWACFNASTFETKDYWLNSLNDMSTAVNFTYAGHKFIIADVYWHGDAFVISWLTDILDSNTDSNIIVATHSYVNITGGYDCGVGGDSWELAFKELLDRYPNVIFTLSGHAHGVYTRVDGNREEMLFNYQPAARVARFLTFDLDAGKVYVYTYDQLAGSWLNEDFNHFSFDVDLI